MFLPLDGPSIQNTLSVGTVTPVEARIGAAPLAERKVVTVQPITGKCYVYFAAEGETPSAANMVAKGFVHFKNQRESYEAGDTQKLWLLSLSGTINIVVAERA